MGGEERLEGRGFAKMVGFVSFVWWKYWFFSSIFLLQNFPGKYMHSYVVEKMYNKLHCIRLSNFFLEKKKGKKENISLFPDMTDGCLGTAF